MVTMKGGWGVGILEVEREDGEDGEEVLCCVEVE